jgi:hypothetical protein
MAASKQSSTQYLFKFDNDFKVSYVNYCRANELIDAQLVVTVEKQGDRQTFNFSCPHFSETDKNLLSADGLYIANIKETPFSQPRIEVGDLAGGFSFFHAKNVKNITPSA